MEVGRAMRGGGFWIGMIIGAAIGAAFGMVYAPKRGEETRGQVVEGVRKFKDVAAEKGRRMLHRRRGMIEEKIEEAREQMAEQS
jgi:gas vesicle protein